MKATGRLLRSINNCKSLLVAATDRLTASRRRRCVARRAPLPFGAPVNAVRTLELSNGGKTRRLTASRRRLRTPGNTVAFGLPLNEGGKIPGRQYRSRTDKDWQSRSKPLEGRSPPDSRRGDEPGRPPPWWRRGQVVGWSTPGQPLGQAREANPQQEKGLKQVHRAPAHEEGQALMSNTYQCHTPARGRSCASGVRRRTKKGRR